MSAMSLKASARDHCVDGSTCLLHKGSIKRFFRETPEKDIDVKRSLHYPLN